MWMPRWGTCCGSVVISAGQRVRLVWRAQKDDELTVWAAEHQAAVVSTDGEFSQRRMQNAIGWHVWLRCSDWEATEVLAFHLAEVLTLLEARNDLTVRVFKEGLTDSSRWT